ncbi:nuclear transport factor 2 family protein [Microbacterium sp. CPCC 204701]|uniref:nuclear transport factor 2 family protein n=1 Tax=Microbacterium sp. CPCC 204701 TaxID=2493084 RepID=UPI000FDAE55C|nr:nuclear transport factor 2 family protein [Microbacterium sp. CPCC 204701]
MTITEADRAERVAVIQTYWDALMAADMATFRSLLAPDAVIHYPGRHYLSGDYTTNDEIVGLYTKLTGFILDGVFVGKVLDIMLGDVHTAVVIEYDLRMPSKTQHGRAIGLFILENGKIKEYWLHEWDQHMINWVFRSSRWFGWLMPLFRRKDAR